MLPIAGRMLECGCGTGRVGRLFLRRFKGLKRVIGVDISDECIKRANDNYKHYLALNEDLENKNIFAKNTFDVVLCNSVLHHFPNIEKIMDNISYC